MSDLEISTWYQSIADHRRTEGTSKNHKICSINSCLKRQSCSQAEGKREGVTQRFCVIIMSQSEGHHRGRERQKRLTKSHIILLSQVGLTQLAREAIQPLQGLHRVRMLSFFSCRDLGSCGKIVVGKLVVCCFCRRRTIPNGTEPRQRESLP